MPLSPSSSRSSASDGAKAPTPVIRVRGLETRIGGRVIHHGLDLDLTKGEILGVVGASGAGKSVLLRTIVGLMPVAAGTIEVFGEETGRLSDAARKRFAARWGVLFQDGALFSSLTVLENIEAPLREHLTLPAELMEGIATLKLSLVGLPAAVGRRYPAELSGGMRKRAGLARALALDPRLLLLDEPTSGLDPISAHEFDVLIKDLKESLNLTVFMVTHDLDSLATACDRVAVLVDKRLKIGTIPELLHDPDPWIQAYFSGPRGRAARVEQRTGGGG